MTYDDLNVMSLEWWLVRGTIPNGRTFQLFLGSWEVLSIVMLNPRKKDQKGLDAAN